MKQALTKKKQNDYEALLDWTDRELLETYQAKTGLDLQGRAVATAKAEWQSKVSERLILCTILGSLILKYIMSEKGGINSVNAVYYGAAGVCLTLIFIISVIVRNTAVNICEENKRHFRDFRNILNAVDPIYDAKRTPWVIHRMMGPLTRNVILNNLRLMSEHVVSCTEFVDSVRMIRNDTNSRPRALTQAQTMERQAEDILKTATSHLWLFDIECQEVEKKGEEPDKVSA